MGLLEDYFKQQLAAGYTYAQLEKQLLKQGYSPKKISKAYSNYQKTYYQKQLKKYIDNQLQQGQTPEIVQEQLVRKGYDSKLVHSLVHPHHGTHHIISFLIVLLVAVGVSIAFLSFQDELTTPKSGACSSFTGLAQDVCFEELSLEQSQPNSCSNIQDISRKDNCFLLHIELGQAIACQELALPKNQHLCRQLSS